MKNKVLTGLLLVLIGGWGSLSAQSNYSRQVNTLIGTKGVGLTSGYLYPGATYPYGMVQFTPSYFSKRSGFVINQLSGGGCEHMGNFPTFPVKGKLKIFSTIVSISLKKKDMQVIMRQWCRKTSKLN